MNDKDSVVIQIMGLVNGRSTAFDGQFVVEYDPGRDGVEPGTNMPMRCHLVTTPNAQEALLLPMREAWALWKKVDPRQPIRPDGKPNRPLTAFTVTIEGVE